MTDRVIFVCTLVLAAVYLYATEQLPSLEIGDPLGPKAFPRLLGAGLVVAALMLLVETMRARKAALPGAAATPSPMRVRKATLVVAGAALWTFMYFLVFEALGYVIATILYLLPLMACFNRGRWTANALTAVLFCVSSYFLFNHLLGVNLARGILPF